MWSLSIEEQFYIVWPPVALLMLRIGRRLRPSWRLWPIFGVAVVGAIASAVDMRLSFQGGASITRLYEGTEPAARTSWSEQRWLSGWPCGPSVALGSANPHPSRRPPTGRSAHTLPPAPPEWSRPTPIGAIDTGAAGRA